MSDRVTLGHGSGGRMSQAIVRDCLLPHLTNPILSQLEDQATLKLCDGPDCRIAFTTDAFVVTPLFFPGGDIGRLAVNGTVNDLAVGGATPLYLSMAAIIEEGLEMSVLDRIFQSVGEAAHQAGVQVVTGDTKVVGRGACDQLFLISSGIGAVASGIELSSHRIQPGDKILISGSIADHGVALFCCRENIELHTDAVSDCAPIHRLTQAAIQVGGPYLRAMRDPTRGGLASTLNEFAEASGVTIEITERAIPIHPEVRSACEVLGFDPLTVANEGKLIAVCASDRAEAVLDALRKLPLGREAAIIGTVTGSSEAMVLLNTSIGGKRIVDLPMGELLPRIC